VNHASTTPPRLQTLVLLAAVFAGAVLLASATAGTAAAQELPGQNETSDEAPTEVTDQLGDLVIHSYDYADGEMTIDVTWRGAAPMQVSITEYVELGDEGVSDLGVKQVRILPDQRRQITIKLAQHSSGVAAAVLSTGQSVNDDTVRSAKLLQAGDATERGPVPFGWAAGLIGLAAIGGAGGAFAFTAREHEDDSAAERRDRIA